jgi:hypothetical protein
LFFVVKKGTGAWDQDPLSAIIGAFLFGCYLFHGVAFVVAAAASFSWRHAGIREISLNTITSEEDELLRPALLPPRRGFAAARMRWKTSVLVSFAASVPAVVFLTMLLPPIWNMPLSSYFVAVSENAWNWTSGELVLKLYLDVVVFYSIFGCMFALLAVMAAVKFVSPGCSLSKSEGNIASTAIISSILLVFAFWLVYWTFW